MDQIYICHFIIDFDPCLWCWPDFNCMLDRNNFLKNKNSNVYIYYFLFCILKLWSFLFYVTFFLCGFHLITHLLALHTFAQRCTCIEGSISWMIFHHNLNLIKKNWYNIIVGYQIRTKCCTYYDSTTTMLCATLQRDSLWMCAEWNFHLIWIIMGKSFMKWSLSLFRLFSSLQNIDAWGCMYSSENWNYSSCSAPCPDIN